MTIRVLTVAEESDRPEAESFIRLRELGFDLRVLCSAKGRHLRRLADAGVPVETAEFRGRRDPSMVARIRSMLAEDIDVLHLYHNRPVACGLAAVRGVTTKVVAYRGIEGNVSFLDPVSWQRYLNPRIDRLACVCDAVRDHFLGLRLLGLRIPPHKPRRIYKGHDLSWYDMRPSPRHALGVPPGAFVVGCVANLRPRKGIGVLIRAAEHLPPDVPIHVVLVGHMEDRRLNEQIARSPIRSRVHRLGFRRDATALAAAFDVAVLPSLRREGLPRSIIEAMAYSVTPVVSDTGGSKELVVDGVSGLVVRSGDPTDLAAALLGLYRDPSRRCAMGAAARVRIERNFSHATFVQGIAKLYEELAIERAEDVASGRDGS